MSRAISYLTHHTFFEPLVMELERRQRRGEVSPARISTMHHAKATELRAKFYTWRQLLRKAHDGRSSTLTPHDGIVLDFSFKISVKILPEQDGTAIDATDHRRIEFRHDDGSALLLQFGITAEELHSLREERNGNIHAQATAPQLSPVGRAAVQYLEQEKAQEEAEATLEKLYGFHTRKDAPKSNTGGEEPKP